MIPQITSTTVIDNGLQLSKNFIIEHLSSGAYHPVLAEWIPRFTATLIPNASLILNRAGSVASLAQIARNLQISADRVLENLLGGFGGDLILRSGFLNNLPISATSNDIQHLIGTAFDIQLRGFENNMYMVANEIQKLTKNVSELNLVFGGTNSWIHVGIDPTKALHPTTLLNEVKFTTTDLITGVVEDGITSLRGFI